MGGLGLNRSREFGDDGVVGSHFVAIGGAKDRGELVGASGERCCEGDGGVGGTDWHGGEVAAVDAERGGRRGDRDAGAGAEGDVGAGDIRTRGQGGSDWVVCFDGPAAQTDFVAAGSHDFHSPVAGVGGLGSSGPGSDGGFGVFMFPSAWAGGREAVGVANVLLVPRRKRFLNPIVTGETHDGVFGVAEINLRGLREGRFEFGPP